MSRLVIVAAMAAAGCAGSWADMGGSVGGVDFTHPASVLHGGSYLLVVDRKLDCQQLGWVARSYAEGASPAPDLPFVAVQLYRRDGFTEPGTADLASGGPVRAVGLVNLDGHLEVHHGREGFLTIDGVGGESLRGGLSLSFAEDGVGGSFQSEFCRDLAL